MKIIVAGTKEQQQEWMSTNREEATVTWTEEYKNFARHHGADAFIDLGFQNEPSRIQFLGQLLPAVVIINCVDLTLKETNTAFIRINAWPGFMTSTLVEAAAQPQDWDSAQTVLSFLGKQIQWVPDEPGFITPRVISMIINEAFLTLEEGVSTKEDIDTAMKLGTNYPFGPFEWAEKIGRQNIRELLLKLANVHSRYQPSSLL